MGIKPPDFKNIHNWDSMNSELQAQLLAYNEIREYEEAEAIAAQAGVKLS